MFAVYSTHDLSETTSQDKCNRPHERKARIIGQLAQLSEIRLVEETAAEQWSLAYRVHAPDFVDFLRTAWDEWAALHDRRDPGFYSDSGEMYDSVPGLVPFQVFTTSLALVNASRTKAPFA